MNSVKFTIVTVLAAMAMVMVLFASPAFAKYKIKSAIVMDVGTGEILYEQNPDMRIAPASLTKVLSMYLVWEDIANKRLSLKSKVKVSKRADNTGGSSMRLRRGERVTIRQLLKGMAVASGNDACIAIAEKLGGVKKFVKRMNKTAKKLGLKHSRFKNPHGLPAKGQVTTARDMLKLAKAYLKRFPHALKIHKARTFQHGKYKRNNTNKLLGRVAGVDGLKTGYVAASGFNLIVTAKRNGRRLIAVILGGRTSKIRNREATKIVEAAFSKLNKKKKPILAKKSPKKKKAPAKTVAKAKTRRKKAAPAPSLNTVTAALTAPPSRPAVPVTNTAEHQLASSQLSPVPFRATIVPPAKSVAPRRDAVPRKISDLRFTLHESSWKSSSKAFKRVNQLRKKGLKATVLAVDLGGKGLWHRVVIGKFNTMQEANSFRKKVASRHDLGHTIILKLT